jgi:hypothetical protein
MPFSSVAQWAAGRCSSCSRVNWQKNGGDNRYPHRRRHHGMAGNMTEKPNVSKVCDCGKGYRSAYDGKCAHCRTAKERSRHWWMIHKKPNPVDDPA